MSTTDINEKLLFFTDIESKSKDIITKEVEHFIPDKTFNISDCDFLIEKLTERISKKLLKYCSSNFKYVINVIFLENSNSGFTQNIRSYCDKETDGVISLHFPYKHITCIVNLIIVSI